MFYTKSFEEKYASVLEVITSCAHLHSDPMIYTDLAGDITGCNGAMIELLNVENLGDIAPLNDWGKIHTEGSDYDVAVKSEVLLVDESPIVGIVFRDVSIIERARAAERYFEHFKKKFLTNISHEFRTPMNAIIGFTDLLKSSPLSSWQKE